MAKATFKDFNTAARMKEVVRRFVREVLDEEMPEPRFAEVTAIDIATRTVEVQFPDESTSFPIKCGALMPVNVGAIVRVAGRRGSRYVDQIATESLASISNHTWTPTRNSALEIGSTGAATGSYTYVGDSRGGLMWIVASFTLGGTGISIAGNAGFDPPAGFGFVFTQTQNLPLPGHVWLSDASPSTVLLGVPSILSVAPNHQMVVKLMSDETAGMSIGNIGVNTPWTWTTGDILTFRALVPVIRV